MVDSKRYNDWFEKAARDIKSAKVLKQNDCGNDVVAFHSQLSLNIYRRIMKRAKAS